MRDIKISQLKLPVGHTKDALEEKIRKTLKINTEDLLSYEIVKQSIDARKKPDIKWVYTIQAVLKNEKKVKQALRQPNVSQDVPVKYQFQPCGTKPLSHRPVIVGLGPAGLLCGYYLAKNGYRPIILERGEDVDARQKSVDEFWETGKLNPESNVQFGEGGAGTFSDGKLNTLVKDKSGRNKEVLRTFVKFGADPQIMYHNKPHIGTDALKEIIRNIRQEICNLGGEVRFCTKMTGISMDRERHRVKGILINGEEELSTEVLVLAIGHSARDTFTLLQKENFVMTAKAFAVGLRMEHPQSMINQAMYGVNQHEILEAADYKVTYNTEEHGIYSFCMCPGGYVVNASSEPGRLAVNGMSYSDRAGRNSNSAIVVTVTPEDYGTESVLSGMKFQRMLEEKAYEAGGGKIPVQCFGDFCENKKTTEFGEITPCCKGAWAMANLREVLPESLSKQLMEGIHGFASQIKDFDRKDAVLSGVESRTSSPVRIERDERFQAWGIEGIYPCGEGAGYAGGITSAAMDGIRIFEAIASQYAPYEERECERK